MQHLRIASRGSPLALWQSETVRDHLLENDPELAVEIEVIRTTGDRILDVPLAKIGDKGLFTKEVDEALLEGRADLAVHSLKDIPTRLPDGLALVAISRREDPRDVVIGPLGGAITLETLPPGVRVGTSSLRRRAQLAHLRPDLEVVDLRGNLNTRLDKLDGGEYAAIILAAAGVLRLGWHDRIDAFLSPADWLPAVGQGALGIVAREDDDAVRSRLESVHHPVTAACVAAERGFLRALEGGCQVPIGALAVPSGDRIEIDGFVSDLAGTQILREVRSGPAGEAESIGIELAEALRARGADPILAAVRSSVNLPGVPPP